MTPTSLSKKMFRLRSSRQVGIHCAQHDKSDKIWSSCPKGIPFGKRIPTESGEVEGRIRRLFGQPPIFGRLEGAKNGSGLRDSERTQSRMGKLVKRAQLKLTERFPIFGMRLQSN